MVGLLRFFKFSPASAKGPVVSSRRKPTEARTVLGAILCNLFLLTCWHTLQLRTYSVPNPLVSIPHPTPGTPAPLQPACSYMQRGLCSSHRPHPELTPRFLSLGIPVTSAVTTILIDDLLGKAWEMSMFFTDCTKGHVFFLQAYIILRYAIRTWVLWQRIMGWINNL